MPINRLTKQEKTFVKEIVETGNATKSVKKAFEIKDDNYAGVKGNRLIRKAKIKMAIKSIADSIPDSLLVEKHLALLNKTDRKFNAEGQCTSEEIDAQAVGKGLEMAYKVKGTYAPEKNETVVKVEKLEEIQIATKKILEGIDNG